MLGEDRKTKNKNKKNIFRINNLFMEFLKFIR